MDSPEGVFVNLATGAAHHGTADGDHLNSIENVTGSFYDDDLRGDDHDNVLSGSWGDDFLMGGAGADTLNGGWGVDGANYQSSPTGVKVYLLWNFASGGEAEGDQFNSIENLIGSEYDDDLMGDNGANKFHGFDGNDNIFGLGGDDELNGWWGKDWLYGGADNDSLWGGEDGDTLSGGPGADMFGWAESYDSGGVLPSGEVDWANIDTVLDFNAAEGDKIDVHLIYAIAASSDNTVAFDFIDEYYAAGGFTAPGQVAYSSDGTDTYLMFNTDETFTVNGGIPDFEFAIRFSGLHTPNMSWFDSL
jgi:Ca2+-binding RTX toxin-like protein